MKTIITKTSINSSKNPGIVAIGKKLLTVKELVENDLVTSIKNGVTFVGIDFGTSTTVVSVVITDGGFE